MTQRRGEQPKGICRVCGLRRSLRGDGTLWAHWLNQGYDRIVGYVRYIRCEGSHQPPKEDDDAKDAPARP